MRKSKKEPPLGLAALPTVMNAGQTARLVLDALHQSGVITEDQIPKNLSLITELIQNSNTRQEIFWKSVYASVNASDSQFKRSAESAKYRRQLYEWLDKKMPIPRKNLDAVALQAVFEKVVPRSFAWTRKQITDWKKSKVRKV